MNPTISIIVPCFNQGEYLEDCLESAYSQTVQAHEIIVINDGSTDNSQEVAERYMFREFPMVESPVRVVTQVNKGLASARNTGIMNATGNYILPLDADDMMLPNTIERITQEIIQTNADIIAPSFQEFGKSDRQVILGGFNMDDLKTANRLGYFSAIRRSALLECGGYSPKMTWGFEDWHIWFDLFRRGKTIAIVQEILMKYRVKDHSMITVANAHSQELYAQIQKDFNHLFQ
jgi:glycosyltransferase involved in cell wall biosynthesis